LKETECDFCINFEKNGKIERAFIKKRPGLDHFLEECSKNFEIVVFTASRKYYATEILDQLDKENKIITKRLFREHCRTDDGINFVKVSYLENKKKKNLTNFIKDLTYLGRNLEEVWIVDNSPVSYSKQPENALPISTWIDDPNDTELLKLLPALEKLAKSKKTLLETLE